MRGGVGGVAGWAAQDWSGFSEPPSKICQASGRQRVLSDKWWRQEKSVIQHSQQITVCTLHASNSWSEERQTQELCKAGLEKCPCHNSARTCIIGQRRVFTGQVPQDLQTEDAIVVILETGFKWPPFNREPRSQETQKSSCLSQLLNFSKVKYNMQGSSSPHPQAS